MRERVWVGGWVLCACMVAACGGDADPPSAGLDGDTSTVDTGPAAPTSPTSSTTGGSVGCPLNKPKRTVGLRLCTDEAQSGYTLFGPSLSTETYLLDLHGEVVHRWDSDWLPGETVYLEENGHLLRTARDGEGTPFQTGGMGGRLQEYDWDGNLVWEFRYSGPDHLQHHDMTRLPNGHVVMIAWELKTEAETEAWGRDADLVGSSGQWINHLIEVDPSTNDIVWEWHLWDHVIQDIDASKPNYGVVADHPELMDFNVGDVFAVDWNHTNGVDYNAELDQLILNFRNQDEFVILDHSTTTAEAASHEGGAQDRGGDFLYRWGNPQNYGAGGGSEQQFFGQHDPEWIRDGLEGAGNVLVFNNAWGGWESAIFELVLPLQPDGSYLHEEPAFGPAGPSWTYTDPDGAFFSEYISGAQRLPNGNTLICEGWPGRIFEVKPDGTKVWEYVNPSGASGIVEQGDVPIDNRVFRADRYPLDFPAFEGRDLTPRGPIE
jgi:hypothetical protein